MNVIIAADRSDWTQALEETEKCLYNGCSAAHVIIVWYFNRLKCTFQRVAQTTVTNVSTQQVRDGSVKVKGRMSSSRSKLAPGQLDKPWTHQLRKKAYHLFFYCNLSTTFS